MKKLKEVNFFKRLLTIFLIFILVSISVSGIYTSKPFIELEWIKHWGLEYKVDIEGRHLALDSNDNIFVIANNGSQGMILHFNENGEFIEESKISYDYLDKLEVDKIEGYFHISDTITMDRKEYQPSFGNILLNATQSNFWSQYENDLVDLRDIEINQKTNELFVLGFFFSEKNTSCTFVTKYHICENSLNRIWTKVIGSSRFLVGEAFAIDSNSNIFVPLMLPNSILKLSPDGEILFFEYIEITDCIYMTDIEINPFTKNVIITGQRIKFLDFNKCEFVIFEIDPKSGKILKENSIIAPQQNTFIKSSQSIAFLDDGNFFATSCYNEGDIYKTKIVKMDRNLNFLITKDIDDIITDSIIFENWLISVGPLVNSSSKYGCYIFNVSNGELIGKEELASKINSFDIIFESNRLKGIRLDNNNKLVTVGGDGGHGDQYGYVSALILIKFIVLDGLSGDNIEIINEPNHFHHGLINKGEKVTRHQIEMLKNLFLYFYHNLFD